MDQLVAMNSWVSDGFSAAFASTAQGLQTLLQEVEPSKPIKSDSLQVGTG